LARGAGTGRHNSFGEGEKKGVKAVREASGVGEGV